MLLFIPIGDIDTYMEYDDAPTCDKDQMLSDWTNMLWFGYVWPFIFVIFAGLETYATARRSGGGALWRSFE